jgi:hypothetical protein
LVLHLRAPGVHQALSIFFGQISSPELQGLIADELEHLGPLDDYVGLTVFEAKRQAVGDPTLYLPLQIR